MATKNPTDLISGIICTALGTVMVLAFTYAVFVEDYLFNRSAQVVQATIDKVEEVKKEEQVSSMGQTAVATVSRYWMHYTYKDQEQKPHVSKWEIAKEDFERLNKPEVKAQGLKVRFQPTAPDDHRPMIDRKHDNSFYYVCAAIYGLSALLLWIGIESFMYA